MKDVERETRGKLLHISEEEGQREKQHSPQKKKKKKSKKDRCVSVRERER